MLFISAGKQAMIEMKMWRSLLEACFTVAKFQTVLCTF